MRKILNIGTMLALAVSVFFISGCKKSSSPNGLIASYTQVLSVNGATTTTVFTFSYDGQNRLTELQETGQQPITFTYGTGQVTQAQANSNTIIYTLNSQGLAVSDNVGDSYVYTNGYLTTKTSTVGGVTSTYTYTVSNGNVVSEVAGTNNYAWTFLSTADYRSTGTGFLGKSNVNLINTETVSNPNTSTYTFTYTFDSKGRVQTQQIVSGANSETDTYTYTD